MRSFLEITEETEEVPVDLVDLDALKLELSIDTGDEDEALEALITRYSRMIAEECERPFGLSQAVETFEFDSLEQTRLGQKLALSLYPVGEMYSITMGGVEVETYSLDKERGLVWINGGAWSGTVVFDYSGGYDLPDDAPAKLQEAVIEAVRDRRLSASQDTTVQSTGTGDTRVSYFNARETSGSLPRGVLDLIQSFKKPALA